MNNGNRSRLLAVNGCESVKPVCINCRFNLYNTTNPHYPHKRLVVCQPGISAALASPCGAGTLPLPPRW